MISLHCHRNLSVSFSVAYHEIFYILILPFAPICFFIKIFKGLSKGIQKSFKAFSHFAPKFQFYKTSFDIKNY